MVGGEMAFGRCNQLENRLTLEMVRHKKPWKIPSKSVKFYKKWKHRRERQRVRANIECWPEYGKYYDYEW
jgi:hypothetical protein